MFDTIGGAIIETLLKFILWPVALVVCTPFILIRGVFALISRKQRFTYAVSDGYLSVSEFWKKWAF